MSRRLKSQVSALLVTGCFASALVLACSGAKTNGSGFDDGSGGSSSGGSSGGSGGSSGGLSSGGGSGGSLGPGGGSGGPGNSDAACAASSSKGQQAPLDIYMMLDYSGSMKDSNKWTSVSSAITQFVGAPQPGVSVGLQYFGLPAGSASGCSDGSQCSSDADCSGGTCVPFLNVCSCGGLGGADSCNAADYAKPEVEIAPMATVGPKISASINAHTNPNTATPTSAALQGAIDHATDWAKAHAGDVTIALLATDGDPSECDTNLTNIDAIAQKAASGTPKILTFVIGVGSSLTNLNGIAAAGGTGQAFLVDTNGNAQQQFLDALNKIRGTALGCNYAIPMPATGSPNYSQVNVQWTQSNGQPVTIPQVTDKGACPSSGNAWYYDNPQAPTQIILCDATCTAVTADTNGEVDVLTGCATIVK